MSLYNQAKKAVKPEEEVGPQPLTAPTVITPKPSAMRSIVKTGDMVKPETLPTAISTSPDMRVQAPQEDNIEQLNANTAQYQKTIAPNVDAKLRAKNKDEYESIMSEAKRLAMIPVDAVNDNVIQPVKEYVQEGHKAVEEKRFGDTAWDDLMVAGIPLLAGVLGGNQGIGATMAGNSLLGWEKRQYDDSVANRKLLENRRIASLKASRGDKPLTKSNIVPIETPQGSKYVMVKDAVDKSPAKEDKFNLAQKKSLESHKASLKDKLNKGVKTFANEARLRDQYNRDDVTKNTKDIVQSFNKIQTLAASPQTGANDISMIFAYMKMLDPASTVREGEQATAKNSGAIPDNIRNMYNRLFNGEDKILPPTVRENFLDEAKNIYASQAEVQSQVDANYQNLAEKYKLNAKNVVSLPKIEIKKNNLVEGKEYTQGNWVYKMIDRKMVPIRENVEKSKFVEGKEYAQGDWIYKMTNGKMVPLRKK